MFLIRAQLRSDASVAALMPLLMPAASGARTGAAHRLIWSLFADQPDRTRDFLWREEASGRFLVLADRVPESETGLFDIEVRDFAPVVSAGDQLAFLLRANPTVQPKASDGVRGQRSDVVMHALRALPAGPIRADARHEVIRSAGIAWLHRQGERSGFTPDSDRLQIEGYETHVVPREGREGQIVPPIRFSTLDFAGVLRVDDPARFLPALRQGFGRAKAFGCGLMLIRRAVRE